MALTFEEQAAQATERARQKVQADAAAKLKGAPLKMGLPSPNVVAMSQERADGIFNAARANPLTPLADTKNATVYPYKEGLDAPKYPANEYASAQYVRTNAEKLKASEPPLKTPEVAPVASQTPAQKFDIEQRAAGGKAFYDKPGTPDTTSGIYDRSTPVKPDRGGSVGNDVVAFQNKNAAAFQNTQQDLASARSAPIQGTDQNRKIAAAEAANEQARIRAESPVERFRMVTPQGEATGLRSANAPRGGFSGSATDAEAARNDQARAQQDAAASSAAASMNRAADIMRSTRESQTVRQAPSSEPRGLFEKAGDGYGDAEMRQNQFESAVSGINERGLTRSQRSGRAKAAEAMLAPFMADRAAEADAAKNQTAQNVGQANAQAQMFTAESQARQAAQNNATNLRTAEIAQIGQNQRKGAEITADMNEKDTKAIRESYGDVLGALKDSKGDPAGFYEFLGSPRLVSQLGSSMGGNLTPDQLRKIITAPSTQEKGVILSLYKANQANTGNWWAAYQNKLTDDEVASRLKAGNK